MRTTGIVRRVDELGRVVIPKEMRKSLGIGQKDELNISIENNAIVLTKVENTCIFCGSDEDLFDFKGKLVCRKCQHEL